MEDFEERPSATGCVGFIFAAVASVVVTTLAFLWLSSAAGLDIAIVAAIFLWWIPATLGYWLGVAIMAPVILATSDRRTPVPRPADGTVYRGYDELAPTLEEPDEWPPSPPDFNSPFGPPTDVNPIKGSSSKPTDQLNRSSTLTPEEDELQNKLNELAGLEERLTERELELVVTQTDLRTFEARYLQVVGTRYAESDRIVAEIAEQRARIIPSDRELHSQATAARARADESQEAAGTAEDVEIPDRGAVSDDLKKLYRQVARTVHPDLAIDEDERTHRTRTMAEVNRAFEDGDEIRLRAILREWETSPERVRGEGTAAELVRTIRKTAQVSDRLRQIDREMALLKSSEMAHLKQKVEDATATGRDLLTEMARALDDQIQLKRSELDRLRREIAGT